MSKNNGTAGKRTGRPPENKATWRCVLRLPEKTAERLRAGADKYEVSINTAIESVLEVWLNEEGL